MRRLNLLIWSCAWIKKKHNRPRKANYENEDPTYPPYIVKSGGTGVMLWLLPWSSPHLWRCRLNQVRSANLNRSLWQCWLSVCNDGENPIKHSKATQLWLCALEVISSKQTVVRSTNIYWMPNMVLGITNAVENETYKVPPFTEIPF